LNISPASALHKESLIKGRLYKYKKVYTPSSKRNIVLIIGKLKEFLKVLRETYRLLYNNIVVPIQKKKKKVRE
jgi:hypothetical protein